MADMNKVYAYQDNKKNHFAMMISELPKVFVKRKRSRKLAPSEVVLEFGDELSANMFRQWVYNHAGFPVTKYYRFNDSKDSFMRNIGRVLDEIPDNVQFDIMIVAPRSNK